MYDCSMCRQAGSFKRRNCDGAVNPSPAKGVQPAYPRGYADAIPATREEGSDFSAARSAWAPDDAPIWHCLRLTSMRASVRRWLHMFMLVTEGGVRFDARDVHPLWSRVVGEVLRARSDLLAVEQAKARARTK
jgi:hypothetical protein